VLLILKLLGFVLVSAWEGAILMAARAAPKDAFPLWFPEFLQNDIWVAQWAAFTLSVAFALSLLVVLFTTVVGLFVIGATSK
jgi:hypothetical protein